MEESTSIQWKAVPSADACFMQKCVIRFMMFELRCDKYSVFGQIGNFSFGIEKKKGYFLAFGMGPNSGPRSQ